MKKLFTTRNIFVALSLVLIIAAFFVTFSSSITYSISGHKYTFTNLILGVQTKIDSGVVTKVSKANTVRAGLSLAGIIIMLIASICAFVFGFILKNKSWSTLATIISGAVIFIGAIFVFCFLSSYAASLTQWEIDNGMATEAMRAKEVSRFTALFKEGSSSAGPWISGTFGVAGAALVIGSPFVSDKPLVK